MTQTRIGAMRSICPEKAKLEEKFQKQIDRIMVKFENLKEKITKLDNKHLKNCRKCRRYLKNYNILRNS